MSYFAATLEASHGSVLELLVESHGKHRFLKVNSTDQRIWRSRKSKWNGTKHIPLLIEQPNGKFVPAFHEIEAAKILEMIQVPKEKSVPTSARPKRKNTPARVDSTKNASPDLDAQLSDVNAAAVLGSLHLHQSRPVPSLTNVQQSTRWKMTARAMKLNEGGRVEVWMDPTEATPGGWASGVIEKLVPLGSGSAYPFFAFYLVKFDHLHVSIYGHLYSEWRPLAYRSTDGAQGISIQVRSEMKKNSGTFNLTVLKVGDQIESKVNGLSCPGVIRKIDENHQCTIEFRSPHLNPHHKIHKTDSHCLLRQSEEPLQGMLSIAG